jgi:hypothetical protein
VLHQRPVCKRYLESFLAEGFSPVATAKTPWNEEESTLLEEGIKEIKETPCLLNEYGSYYKYLSHCVLGSTRSPGQVAARCKYLTRVLAGEANNPLAAGPLDDLEDFDADDVELERPNDD